MEPSESNNPDTPRNPSDWNPSPDEPRVPDRPIVTPASGPPGPGKIPSAVYEAMGEENIFAFAEAFYRRLGESAAAPLFPKGDALIASSFKTGAMFVFLFGGPHLYQQRYGAPRMRMRHVPFHIGPRARDEWMRCFRETLAEAPVKFGMPAEHVGVVETFFDEFSRWMVNAADDVI